MGERGRGLAALAAGLSLTLPALGCSHQSDTGGGGANAGIGGKATWGSSVAAGSVDTGWPVCNQTGTRILVATAYHDAKSGAFVSQGWTPVAAGICGSVLKGADLADNIYYVYAYISNRKETNNPDWGGYDYFCLSWDATFRNDKAKDNADCTRTETQNEQWVGFFSVDASQSGGLANIHY